MPFSTERNLHRLCCRLISCNQGSEFVNLVSGTNDRCSLFGLSAGWLTLEQFDACHIQ